METDQQKIQRLETENEDLRAEIEWLKVTERIQAEMRAALGKRLALAPAPTKMVIMLARSSGMVSKESLTRRLYDDDIHIPENIGKQIDLYICRIRKVLGKESIATIWGQGFEFTDEGRHKLIELLSISPDMEGWLVRPIS